MRRAVHCSTPILLLAVPNKLATWKFEFPGKSMTLWQVFDRHSLRLLKIKKKIDEELNRDPPMLPKSATLSELKTAEDFLISRSGRLRASLEEADAIEKKPSLKEQASEVRRTAAAALCISMCEAKRVCKEISLKEVKMAMDEEMYGETSRAIPGLTKMHACELSMNITGRLAAIKPHVDPAAVGKFEDALAKFKSIEIESTEKMKKRLSTAVLNFETSETILAELDAKIPAPGLPENLKNLKESLVAKVNRTASIQSTVLLPSAVRLDALAGTDTVASELVTLQKAVGKAETDTVTDNTDALRSSAERLKKLSDDVVDDKYLPTSSDLKRLEKEEALIKERLRQLSSAEYPALDSRLIDAMEQSIKVFEEAKHLMGKI